MGLISLDVVVEAIDQRLRRTASVIPVCELRGKLLTSYAMQSCTSILTEFDNKLKYGTCKEISYCRPTIYNSWISLFAYFFLNSVFNCMHSSLEHEQTLNVKKVFGQTCKAKSGTCFYNVVVRLLTVRSWRYSSLQEVPARSIHRGSSIWKMQHSHGYVVEWKSLST